MDISRLPSLSLSYTHVEKLWSFKVFRYDMEMFAHIACFYLLVHFYDQTRLSPTKTSEKDTHTVSVCNVPTEQLLCHTTVHFTL